jgi:integrase
MENAMPRERKLPPGLWKRGRVYYARFRANGRLVRKRLSTDFCAACELLNELRARADKADFGLVDNDYPYEELKAKFIRWARQSVRNPHEYEADLKRFEQFSMLRNVRQIDQDHVMAYRAWRLAQTVGGRPGGRAISPRTVNREVNTLTNMLNKGVKWKKIGSNSLVGLKPLPHDERVKNRRALTLDEVQAVFDHSPPHLRPVWRMFMCTGIRHSELVELRFSNIDFQRRIITIPASRAKNHKAREIPLDDTMLETLVELRGQARHRNPIAGTTAEATARQAAGLSKDHVFVTLANTPLRSNLLRRFYKVCEKAGVDDACRGGAVDIHSLRVTFTTLSLEHGANPRAVQGILGHSTLAMTMGVYAKATERSKRAAVDALPFASATAPDHILAVHDAHTVSTVKKPQSQPHTDSVVA